MHVRQRSKWLFLMLLSVPCMAQRSLDPVTQPLKTGSVTVWWVRPTTDEDRARIAAQKLNATIAPIKKYVEHTTSEFGQPSSNVGQTAGNYNNQTPGSLGQTVGNAGQAASSDGTTADSFGQTASSFGESPSDANKVKPVATAPIPKQVEASLRGSMLMSLGGADVQVVHVVSEEFEDKLAAVTNSRDYPDIVVGIENLPSWSSRGLGLTMFGLPILAEPDSSTTHTPWRAFQRADILLQAPHPVQARAFVVWLRDEGGCDMWCGNKKYIAKMGMEDAVTAAQGAFTNVLQGGAIKAYADKDAAEFSGPVAQSLAFGDSFGGPSRPIDMEHLRIDTMALATNERHSLAAVTLRAVIPSEGSFGVVHAQVVLRKGEGGGWGVLQISSNLRIPQLGEVNGLLAQAMFGKPDESAPVLGVSQAAPLDGDNRSPQPYLWWDNLGGAALQVVEWQTKAESGWTNTNLEPVSDTGPRLKTEVVASFARQAGQYRWRVWSVGKGGELKLSPWHSLIIVGG